MDNCLVIYEVSDFFSVCAVAIYYNEPAVQLYNFYKTESTITYTTNLNNLYGSTCKLFSLRGDQLCGSILSCIMCH